MVPKCPVCSLLAMTQKTRSSICGLMEYVTVQRLKPFGVSKLPVFVYAISRCLCHQFITLICMVWSYGTAITYSDLIFQVVYSALSVHMICLNLTKAAVTYHKAQYLGVFFSHSILLLSVHLFPRCHSITTHLYIRW